MLSEAEYHDALKIAQSYLNVNPTPESRYGQRLAELIKLIEAYELAHGLKSGMVRWARGLRGVG
jgi:hypothetical protein